MCGGQDPGGISGRQSPENPGDALKPLDARYKSAESLLETIDRKKKELDERDL